jgi:BASS family bile acid:Na+ symporter
MPLLALWLSLAFHLNPAVKIALVALAVSPLPPRLTNNALMAGGDGSYTIGLLVAASLLSIVLVPATVFLVGQLVDATMRVPAVAIAEIVGATVLVPLAIGIGVRRIMPAAATRAAKTVERVATLALAACVIPLLVTSWPAFTVLVGNGTLAVITAMTLVGLLVGHFLGGPSAEHRTVLALATASRHPAVAIAIAGATFPAEKLAVPAILLALCVGALTSVPYIAWRKRAARAPASFFWRSRSHIPSPSHNDHPRRRRGERGVPGHLVQ